MRQVRDKWRRTPAALVLGLLLTSTAACTSSGSSSTSGTSSTASATSSSAGLAASTTTSPVPPPVPISIPRASDGTSPDGSGCDPPAGDRLPDGLWFGVLANVNADGSVGLDLACWFSGQAAQAAAGSSTPVPNDYYIRNENPRVYQLPTAPQVAVLSLAESGASSTFNPATTGATSANAILSDHSHHYVWVQITHGYVVVIQGQFTP